MTEQPSITLTLSLDHVNLIFAILGEQPFNKIAPLLVELRGQAERQVQTVNAAQNGQAARPNGGMPAQ